MDKKTFIAAIIFVLVLMTLAGAPPIKAVSRTIVVPSDYATIQGAINAANNGDTIMVAAGRYYEGVLVNKSVTVVGESPATTTVYGTVQGYQSSSVGNPFHISADNVVIANMAITQGDEYHGAIKVSSSQNVIIRDNVVSEGGYSGIAVAIENCVNFSVTENTIVRRGGRIHIQDSRIGDVSRNKLTGLEYTILAYSSPNVTFLDNSIFQCEEGIQLTDSANNTLRRNRISSINGAISAISLSRCPGSLLRDNEATNCTGGISISESCCCVLRNNTIADSSFQGWGGSSFSVYGYEFGDFELDIDSSNTVDGKPIYYLVGRQGVTINPSTYPNVGYLALINCTRVTVEDLSLSNCSQGILLAMTTNSQIKNNNISNSADGISLAYYSSGNLIYGNNFQANFQSIRSYYSSNNTIINNDMANSGVVWIDRSSNYTVFGNTLGGFKLVAANNIFAYHNNFKGFDRYPGEQYSSNMGYPTGGSYYPEYDGVDLKNGVSQGIPGPDGIGDTAYYSDYYPLMAPVRLFDAGIWGGKKVYVELESNSTLSDFEIDNINHAISFTASGSAGSIGFCRVGIPKIISQDAWGGSYQIVVNGKSCLYTPVADAQNVYSFVSYSNESIQQTLLWVAAAAVLVVAVALAVFLLRKRLRRN